MSQENVELVRRFLEAFNETGEFSEELLDPDVAFVIDPASFVAGTYRGHDGVRTLLRLTAEVFDEFRYELDELIDLDDAVLALIRMRVRGTQSGAVGTQEGALEFRFNEGRIVLYRSYLRRQDGLEALNRG
jgi:ketosteroid isomerase-like protein